MGTGKWAAELVTAGNLAAWWLDVPIRLTI